MRRTPGARLGERLRRGDPRGPRVAEYSGTTTRSSSASKWLGCWGSMPTATRGWPWASATLLPGSARSLDGGSRATLGDLRSPQSRCRSGCATAQFCSLAGSAGNASSQMGIWARIAAESENRTPHSGAPRDGEREPRELEIEADGGRQPYSPLYCTRAPLEPVRGGPSSARRTMAQGSAVSGRQPRS
jgi:hypothetical protein